LKTSAAWPLPGSHGIIEFSEQHPWNDETILAFVVKSICRIIESVEHMLPQSDPAAYAEITGLNPTANTSTRPMYFLKFINPMFNLPLLYGSLKPSKCLPSHCANMIPCFSIVYLFVVKNVNRVVLGRVTI
jgi:hypothetical protein